MKTVFLSLIAGIFGSSAVSFAQDFLPPYVESPFSVGVVDRETNQPLAEGNWAFDITIRNPNNRDVYCKKSYFVGRIGLVEDQCTKADNSTLIQVPDGDGFPILANDLITFPQVGYEERLAKKKELGDREVQYCGREPLVLNCGFICANGRIPGDSWTQELTGGIVTYTCNQSGDIVSSLACDPSKYSPNATASACVPRSCSSHVHGSTWSESVPNGTQDFSCEFGEVKNLGLRCLEPVYKNINGICLSADRHETLIGEQIKGMCGKVVPNVARVAAPGDCVPGQAMMTGPYWNLPSTGRVKVSVYVYANITNKVSTTQVRGHGGRMRPSFHREIPMDDFLFTVDVFSISRGGRLAPHQSFSTRMMEADSADKNFFRINKTVTFELDVPNMADFEVRLIKERPEVAIIVQKVEIDYLPNR